VSDCYKNTASTIDELDNDGETSLIKAIKKSSLEEVSALIKAGANVNKADINTETPLHWAAYSKNLEIAKLLIHNKANINATNCKRYTAIFYALFVNNLEMLELLYANGADLHTKAFFDGTLLHFAANGSTKEIVQFCIDHNLDINARSINKETPLAWAMYGKKPELIELLTKNGATIKDVFDIWGNSILDAALLENNSESVKKLLACGADILSKNPMGRTCLHTAVSPANERINLAMVELLVSFGADVNAIQNDGTSVLMWAVKYASLDIVKLLIEKGAQIDPIEKSKSVNVSVIHNALLSANEEIVNLILNKATQFDFKDRSGKTPLMIASERGLIDAVKALLNKKANLHETDDYYQRTALHEAVIHGYDDIALILIEAGANIETKDKDGKNALNYASQYSYKTLVNTLTCIQKNAVTKSLVCDNALLSATIKNGSAIVWYLGNSGWAVKTANNFIILDYSDVTRIPNNASIMNGHIVSEEIKDIKVTVFVSNIPLEHWNPQIFSWKDTIKNCTYVYGFNGNKIKPYIGPEYTQFPVNTTNEINGIEVTTLLSNAGGCGYLITLDGITIYHAGDHPERTEDGSGPYRGEIDLIANKKKQINLAFLPIEGDYLGSSEIIELGNSYTIETLTPKVVFPMHCGGNEKSYDLYCKSARLKHKECEFITVQNRGDYFEYTR